MKKFLKKQLGHFTFGLIVWLPMGIIAAMGLWLFQRIENSGQKALSIFSSGKALPTGLGFLLVILLVYLSGIVLKIEKVRNFFAKIPFLGIFLGQKEGKMMSLERLLNLRPCLFMFSPTCPSYGFILSEEHLSAGEGKAPSTLLNVYYPNVPTIIMGQIFPVRKETVIRLGNSPKEIIDLLLYASRSPRSIKCLPWENESEKDFEIRTANFGIKR